MRAMPRLAIALLLAAFANRAEALGADLINISGLWLDAERGAQGLMVEQLDPPEGAPDGGEARVVVSWFTWAPASDPEPGPRWLFGVGRREGATVIVDPVTIARRGTFPIDAPVASPELDDWGRLEIEFIGDLAPEGAVLRFEGPPAWGDGERDLYQITASGYGIDYGTSLSPPLPNIGTASGNYSSPAHPGQGWVLNQYARPATAADGSPRRRVEGLLIWYTYDADGRPVWVFGLASDMESDSNFVMQQAVAGGTFEGGEPQLEAWGGVRLFGAGPPGGFQVSCNAQDIAWDSTRPGFGESGLALHQITRAYLWNMSSSFCFSTN